MFKNFQLHLLLSLFILLLIDLILIKSLTFPSNPSILTQYLERRLNTSVQLIDSKETKHKIYLTYVNQQSSHLDLAIFERHQLISSRYSLQDIRESSLHALTSSCHVEQNDEALIVWGKNLKTTKVSLIVKLNDEVFVETLAPSAYFLKIYLNQKQIGDCVQIEVWGPNGENLTSDFLSVQIPH